MRVEVLSLCLVAAALSSYFFPAKVQAMSSCMSNGFTRGPPNLTLTVGDTGIVLSCEVDAPGDAIQWIHTLNGKDLQRIDSFEDAVLGVFITSKTGNLTLGNEVSVRHHGEYQCTLQAPCFQLFSDIGHITVTGPSFIQLDKHSQAENSGEFESQLVIGINVFGSPQPSFTLLKRVQSNKRAVEEFQGVNISDGRISINLTTIKFTSLEFTDEGSYQLWANNSEGGSVIEFRVDVTGVVKPTVTLTKSELTPMTYGDQENKNVICSVPREAYDTDSGVLTIEWLRKPGLTKVAKAETGNVYQTIINNTTVTLTLRHLAQADNGEYLCWANNSRGMSNESIIIAGPPAKVTSFTGDIQNSMDARLQWSTPDSYGVAIVRYVIRYNHSGGNARTETVSHDSQSQPQQETIENLCPVGMWTFTVSAVNEFNAMGEESEPRTLEISGSHCMSMTTTTSSSSPPSSSVTTTTTSVSSSTSTSSSTIVPSVTPTPETSKSTQSSPLPIAAGGAAGAIVLIVLVVILIVFIVCYVKLKLNRRGSKAEQQWIRQSGEDRIDNGYIEANPINRSPDPVPNGIGVGLPSPIPVESSFGPVYIDPRYEFPRENLELTDILYDGAYTVIYKAKAVGIKEGKPVDVAVKCLKEEFLDFDDYSSALIMEMEQLAQLEPHPNIVTLVRVCSVTRPVLMVMEYMCHGDLLGFLRTTRGHSDMYTVDPGTKNLPTQLKLTSRDLLNIIRQVAMGMQFLSEQKIVHGALCARNVLVGTSMEVKIFNIGMHNLDNDETFDSLVRWMAPEVFEDGIRTANGDVWSFGILMWEVVTLGGTPYSDLVTDDLYAQLMSGYRLQKPPHCAQPVYDLMGLCWESIPQHRPLFYEICDHLENLNLSKMSYLDLRKYNDTAYSQFDDSEKQLSSIL